jgi:hypothetical protein
MRRTGITLLVLLTGTALLSLNPAHGVFARGPQRASHQDFPPVPGGTPFVVGLPNLNPPTATAVPAGANPHKPVKPAAPPDAVRAALSNAFVKALLRGKAYRVQKVAQWKTGNGKVVIVGFYHPVTVSGTWLAVGKRPFRATYRNVTSLGIYVNVSRSAVMAIVAHPR